MCQRGGPPRAGWLVGWLAAGSHLLRSLRSFGSRMRTGGGRINRRPGRALEPARRRNRRRPVARPPPPPSSQSCPRPARSAICCPAGLGSSAKTTVLSEPARRAAVKWQWQFSESPRSTIPARDSPGRRESSQPSRQDAAPAGGVPNKWPLGEGLKMWLRRRH